MENPEDGDPPQPAHVDDFNEMPNDGNPFNDHGGVHYNSGIPNHAYYLMVQAIGRDAAEAIVYRALTEELEEDSDFEDFRTASLAVAARAVGQGQPRVPRHQRVLRGGRARRDVGSSRGGGMLMRMLLLAGFVLVLLAGCGEDDGGGGGEPSADADRAHDLRARRRDRRPARPADRAAGRQREADRAGQDEVDRADRQGARRARARPRARRPRLAAEGLDQQEAGARHLRLPRELRRHDGHHRRHGDARASCAAWLRGLGALVERYE